MLDIRFNEKSPRCYDGNVFVLSSDEIERVLAMDLPAAIVVSLPSYSFGRWSDAKTYILLYFPENGKVSVYEYTRNDPRRIHKGTDIKEFGQYCNDLHSDEAFPEIKRYMYAVDLCVFGHRPREHKICKVVYEIDFEASVGVARLYIECYHDDDNRDNEKLTLSVGFGSNEGDLRKSRKVIGIWTPWRDKLRDILTWGSCQGVHSTLNKSIPHINNFHSEDRDDEADDT